MDGNETYPHKDLTEKIIGASFDVHNELGSGFVEKVYENALAMELRRRGLTCKQQQPVSVSYRDESVGEFVADLIVESVVLVEIKAVKAITSEFESKLIHYLKTTGIEVGLLINFGERVELRRKIYSRPSAGKSVTSVQSPSAPPSAKSV